MAPPAEWPVIRREEVLRDGSSWRSERRREETGAIIRRAAVRKPEWQRLPGSSWWGLANSFFKRLIAMTNIAVKA